MSNLYWEPIFSHTLKVNLFFFTLINDNWKTSDLRLYYCYTYYWSYLEDNIYSCWYKKYVLSTTFVYIFPFKSVSFKITAKPPFQNLPTTSINKCMEFRCFLDDKYFSFLALSVIWQILISNFSPDFNVFGANSTWWRL